MFNLTRYKNKSTDYKWYSPTNYHVDEENYYSMLMCTFGGFKSDFVSESFLRRDYVHVFLVTQQYGSKISIEKFLLKVFQRSQNLIKI